MSNLKFKTLVLPDSAILIWIPFVCRCHSGLLMGVGLFNGQGDTLVHKMTASCNKTVSAPRRPHNGSCPHPVTEWLTQHFLQNKHITAKRNFCCYLAANFPHCATPDTYMRMLRGNEKLSISKILLVETFD